jgi:ADP-L-glycero-D-manno-heptose 6-epimerase
MILVTGGAGFIGSVLVAELNKSGRKDILIVDRLRDSTKWLNLRKLQYSSYLHSDQLFLKENEAVFNDLEAIFHIGACSSTTEMNMDYLMENNVNYSKKLFKIATEKNIPIIYASSAATYGSGELGYEDDHSKFGKLIPLNPYGYSKKIFDDWVLTQEKRPDLWYGLKYFNVYGPNEYHKGSMRSIVHKAFGQIKEKGVVNLFKSHKDGFKDGEQLRDFIYVVDIAKIMVKLLEKRKSRFNGIYNMGTGKAQSFYQLVGATFKALDLETKVNFVDMPLELRDQYQYYTQATMDKFNTLMPEFKFSTLEEGVSDYVKNYLDTADPYYS